MGHRYLNVKPVGQMLGQMFGAVNRAVLSASASKTNLKMGELPLNEAFDMVIDKVIDVVQELCDSAVILKEFYDLLVEPRELTVMLVLAWIVDGAAVKDVASSIAGCVNRDAFLVSETEDSHFQTFVLGDVVELRHRGEFGEDLVQIRIILERLLEKATQVTQSVRNARKEMRFLLEIASETVRAQHLESPEQDEQPEPFVEMSLVHIHVALQSAKVGLNHFLAEVLRVT